MAYRSGGSIAVRPRTVEASFEADAAPLPQLLTEDELTSARLIKLDIEGGEAAAVRGLAPHLPRLRHDAELVIEVPRRARRSPLGPPDACSCRPQA